MTRGVCTLVGLVALFAGAPAWAAPVNFSGEWELDKSRSDTMEPMLERCGLNWVERKAAAAFQPSVRIVHKDDVLDITNRTFISDIQTRTLLDNKPHVLDTPLGPMTVTARWTQNGTVVSSDSVTKCERNDAIMVMSNTRRFLKTKNEMELVMVVTLKNGKRVKMRRVFVRAKK